MEFKQYLENPDFHKKLASINFSYFNKYYLELDTPAHQKRWCQIISKELDHLLLLAPRDHGKSMVCTYAFPIWSICNNPNIRILIISKTVGQARKFLMQIQQTLERNKNLIKTFGPFRDKEDARWTQTYMYVPRDSREKDPTIEVCGVMGAITGGHFDIIIADDILDDENTRTSDRMKGIEDWFFGTIRHLAEPWTEFLVVGTRKHYLDLYNNLLNNPVWSSHVDKAIVKFPAHYEYVTDDKGKIVDVDIQGECEVLWEDKWDIKTLLIERRETGSILFDREKQNDPSGMRGQLLKLEWLHFYTTQMDKQDLPHMPVEFKYKFFGVDLAVSQADSADYFALAVVGVCKNNNWWIVDIYRNKLEFPEQVNIIERFADIHKPMRVYVENNQYQQALVQHMQRFTSVPVLPKRTAKDKTTRMLAISPYFESGKVRVRDDMDNFVTEWLHFPKGKHDDMLDAVEIALTEIKNPSYSTRPIGVKMKRDKIYDAKTKELDVNKTLKHFKRQGSQGKIFRI